ncbi:TAXI family TRAP transporter solute-binding subunit [Pseudooceanicola nanhaiensis]|jgi:TRAP transporter TAXI family solute receptor|uniref:C4-dicarboxylate ABC transporter n=2 Tax=Pseudooceanicola nanhaiensis TaxID=375761 RepID=A0A917T742_9RHOB|nr:TAXI family TRAP transporter solute-binding subunit [Pseudooceanicola nanhaiensis]GGM11885.1 C4-dicarboxylate ABC transporter [Pseudooceanicola nanhaiensis]
MTRLNRRQTMALMGAAGLAPMAPAILRAQDKPAGLPDTMIWSTYDVGSTGYVEATAIADAMIKNYGTRVRLLPSGSGVGRIIPLKQGQANTAWLANELYFATRGIFDFATPEWGPQNMRTICGRPASFGIAVTQESGIETIEDLRGKRVAYAAANPSVAIKVDTMIGSKGLTRDDVEVIEFPSYADTLRALTQGQADAAGGALTAAALTELEASPRGIRWLSFDPNDKQMWENMNKIAPLFSPYRETIGVGVTGKDPVDVVAYKYPMVTVMHDADPEMTYGFLKALDESYPGYKDAAPIMESWGIKQSGTTPMDAPFHEGAIRYLQEIGQWTDEQQAWNDAAVKEIEALIAAWPDFLSENSGLSGDELAAAWDAKRKEITASL